MRAWKLRLTTISPRVAGLMVLGLMLCLQVGAAFAQTNTPVPPTATATVVMISIPTNVIFTETNNWLATFAPIAAIGIGVTLALAVLAYIGKLITSAFR